MKIKYLGTAAAEAIPAFFCTCRVCTYARIHKGKEIKSRSQALVNDELLLDFSPDTFMHLNNYDLDLSKIHDCLITHSHEDHFCLADIIYIKQGFAAKVSDEKFHIYSSDAAYNRIQEKFKIYKEELTSRLDATLVPICKPFKVKDYTIVALPGNHDIYSSPVMYLISKDNKTMLYAHDTGIFKEESFNYLKENHVHLDLLSLDCTLMNLTNWKDHHLSYDTFLEQVEALRKENIVDKNTIIVANHFSHNGNATHEEFSKLTSKDNIITSFDGMEINF